MSEELIKLLMPHRYWIAGVGVWLCFGWAGFLTWVYDAIINKIRIRFIEWVKLFFLMLLMGGLGWLLSFMPLRNYLIKR